MGSVERAHRGVTRRELCYYHLYMNEKRHNEDGSGRSWWCCGCGTKRGGLGWGIFFLVLGGYFILQNLGYINPDLSLWPILAVAFGAYLVIRGLVR